DYDGDGKADLMVYQAANGLWLCALSSQGYATQGLAGIGGPAMIPRPGDYDNDGKTDPAVYDPIIRAFYVLLSGSNYQLASLSW
ncbi:MAG: VCBS repeat-containing protein, partial [Kiritimatiellota bacterium]|nr:VCBS repeat-containing protein [Kiritimatiellota bacterium]